ncbi:hypothetical protein XI25_09120 [Paenibacillus sp. DMB20]|nr:hypothetical protein XI25_09120 [Paenibacillus sp. DMB20]
MVSTHPNGKWNILCDNDVFMTENGPALRQKRARFSCAKSIHSLGSEALDKSAGRQFLIKSSDFIPSLQKYPPSYLLNQVS